MNSAPVSSYILTKHAAEQIEMRFGFTGDAASRWANEQMAAAIMEREYKHDVTRNKLREYKARGVRFVVDGTRIVTAKPVAIETASIVGGVNAYIIRQLQRMRRDYKRLENELNGQIGAQLIEIGKLTINHSKAKSPAVRHSITEKIAAEQAKVDAIKMELKRAADRLENERRAAKEYGAEVAQ